MKRGKTKWKQTVRQWTKWGKVKVNTSEQHCAPAFLHEDKHTHTNRHSSLSSLEHCHYCWIWYKLNFKLTWRLRLRRQRKKRESENGKETLCVSKKTHCVNISRNRRPNKQTNFLLAPVFYFLIMVTQVCAVVILHSLTGENFDVSGS